MIACLEGTVRAIRAESIVLWCAPIGYEVFVPKAMHYHKGQELFLWTYQQFREDGQVLYGFEREEEYDLFTRMITVKGIGPKSVMNMFSKAGFDVIVQAIDSADVKALQKLPGIGPKSAGQIVLDLKGKVTIPAQVHPESRSDNPVWNDVADALESMGFRRQEIEALAPEMSRITTMDVNTMLKKCLQQLAIRNGV